MRTRPRLQITLLFAVLFLASTGLLAGCGPDDRPPTPEEALLAAQAWLKAAPVEASGSAHQWIIADEGRLGRHRQGPSPGLESALGPFMYRDETYYFAFADQPGEQWYELRPEDVNAIWADADFTLDQKQGLATLLAAMRLVNPERLIAAWDPADATITEGSGDSWLLRGVLETQETAFAGLTQPARQAALDAELFPGDIEIELSVSREDGRPLEAGFNPERGRPFSYTFSRTEQIPEPPEETIGVRTLLEEGPVGSPAS